MAKGRYRVMETLGLPGPQRMGISLELVFIPPTFISKSKCDVMKVFTTFIFAAKNKLGAQLLFPHEQSWDEAPTYFSWGKQQLNTQTYFSPQK